jgi:hypothetical protein
MNGTSRRIRATAAVAGVAAATVGAGVGVARMSTDARPQGGGPTVSEATARGQLGHYLSLFRRAQRPDEAEQGRAATGVPVQSLTDGENVALVRRVDLPSGPVSVWPARDQVCYGHAGASGCTPVLMLEHEGVIPSAGAGVALGKGTVVVSGIARDGITSVTIEVNGSPDVTATVTHNVFLETVQDALPVAVRWTDSRGAHRLPLGLSQDADTIEPNPLDRVDR